MSAKDEKAVEIKALGAFEIKDEAKGEVEAVIATLGVVDKDGDIIRSDAITSGSKVKMSAYGHDAMWGEMPVGKGTITVKGERAVFKGNMFMSTSRGREVFSVLKEMGPEQEWSFGFRVTGWEAPSDDERKQGAARILTKLDAFEVSPVIIGAGINTRTLAVKEEKPAEPPAPEPEPTPTPEEIAAKEKAESDAKAAKEQEERAAEQAKAARDACAREIAGNIGETTSALRRRGYVR